MRRELFAPSREGEARLLLLINEFSRGTAVLEGRTKLAKLDFLLRYPNYLSRAIEVRTNGSLLLPAEAPDLETPMIRYRFGPWDPAYFSLLGSLLGKGLIQVVPMKRGLGYKATPLGGEIASSLRDTEAWSETGERARLLRQHFNLTGATLKKFVYETFPEVTGARLGEVL